MKIAIIGAGIGGLSAGIALRQRGWSVTIFEQAQALTQIGAGLQISPNGARVLEALGVMDDLRPDIFEPRSIDMRWGTSGKPIFELPMRDYAKTRWGAGYYHIHRADLVDALAARFEHLGGTLVLDTPVSGFSESHTSVRLETPEPQEFDLLIGADGLKSMVRAKAFDDLPTRFTGQIAWRCTVPVSDLGGPVPPESACVWVGDKRHAVTTRVKGGEMVNFVGMVEKNLPADEAWDLVGSKKTALSDFKEFSPVITGILDRAETINIWPLYDRPVLETWHSKRVVLLGDAAHPMLPSMAQGAVQALEDAWVLATCLDQLGLSSGLKAYVKQRKTRTAKIQRMSAKNANLFHQNNGLKGAVLYRGISVVARLAPGLLQARQDWVYGHDVVSVQNGSAELRA